MISKKLNKKALVIVPVAAAVLGAGTLLGYANYPKFADGWDPGGAKTDQEISRGESPGEYGPGGEQGVRGGARLIRYYDAGSNAFVGTVENTTGSVLSQVRSRSTSPMGRNSGPPFQWTWLPNRRCWSSCPPRRSPSPDRTPMPRSAAARASVSMALVAPPAVNRALAPSEGTTPSASAGAAARAGQHRLGVVSSIPAEYDHRPLGAGSKRTGARSGPRP